MSGKGNSKLGEPPDVNGWLWFLVVVRGDTCELRANKAAVARPRPPGRVPVVFFFLLREGGRRCLVYERWRWEWEREEERQGDLEYE
jgi:hypothetical protein